MSFRIFVLFAFRGLIVSAVCNAQDFELKQGKPEFGKLEHPQSLARNSLGYYFVTAVVNNKFTIARFDTALNLANSKSIDIRQGEEFIGVYNLKDNFIYLCSVFDEGKKTITLFADEFDGRTLTNTGGRKQLEEVDLSKNKPRKKPVFFAMVSADHSKLMALFPVADSIGMAKIGLFDDKLNLIAHDKIRLSSDKIDLRAMKAAVDNSGSFVFAGKSGGDSVVANPSKDKGFFLNVLDLVKRTSKQYFMSKPNDLKNTLLALDGNLVSCVSLDGHWIYLYRVDLLSGKIIESKTDLKTIHEIKERLGYFVLKDIIVQGDGSVLVGSEKQYSSNGRRTPLAHHCDDVLLTHFSPKLEFSWATIIKKSQWTYEQRSEFMSYSIGTSAGKTCVIYNENAKTFAKNLDPALHHADFDFDVPVIVFIGPKGEQVKKPIYDITHRLHPLIKTWDAYPNNLKNEKMILMTSEGCAEILAK